MSPHLCQFGFPEDICGEPVMHQFDGLFIRPRDIMEPIRDQSHLSLWESEFDSNPPVRFLRQLVTEMRISCAPNFGGRSRRIRMVKDTI